MKGSLGRLVACLSDEAVEVNNWLIDCINRNVSPPNPVGPNDVHIRAMFVVSDEVNSFGGCFPRTELQRMTDLIVDSPVMVGHRKDRLPIGRIFFAKQVERSGGHWVKAYFYWLKSAEGAVSLAENLDGGVYKECSVGFTFGLPECSVCGEDIRTCSHQPFESYDLEGQSVKCHYNYRKIERVLETSLVYRGAVKNTAVTKELAAESAEPPGVNDTVASDHLLQDLDQFSPDESILAVPYYDGPWVRLTLDGRRASVTRLDGGAVGPFASLDVGAQHPEPIDWYGQLVAYRGKERLGTRELERFLQTGKGAARRIDLKLLPQNNAQIPSLVADLPLDVSLFRHVCVLPAVLDEAGQTLKTKMGVRVWSADKGPNKEAGFRYQPRSRPTGSHGRYRILVDNTDHACFEIQENGSTRHLRIRHFHMGRLGKGARFVADSVESLAPGARTFGSGEITQMNTIGETCHLKLEGFLAGRFSLRPCRLQGKRRLLFYRAIDS